MKTPTLDEAFAIVQKLAADFHASEAHYLSPAYQESEVRKDFIDKFFIALGWDVYHDEQKNPFQQEVKVERSVSAGDSQRRADYAFYVAPNFRPDDVRFFVEAKKPFGDIATADNCFQAIRYGWPKKTPLAALTDFEQFAILDCRYKPAIDTARERVLREYHYSEYADPEKFAEIYYLFSRDAVANGSLEKYAESLSKRRGKAMRRGLPKGGSQNIDDAFLEVLDGYRDTLAHAFKNHNPDLDGETLTEITQRTLDRLVFMRFLEDKMIYPERLVSHFGDKGCAWQDFVAASRRLDAIYNGIVFKRHVILDSPDFQVDGGFEDICKELADADSIYNFNDIPIHILGSIYERFLGKVIVTTDKRARVEEKPEVRKAGGVYYTPEYIVRYIVENTVGKLIEGKTPAQIVEMRFADIACGSGSFLLGIYDLLLRYHRDWFNARPKQAEKAGCVLRGDGAWHLSLSQRREILINNIFGVDIDHQAVEVAQLSLYLKLLEEETTASARAYQLEFPEPLLPLLNRNIVCGNSLIETDILEGHLFEPKEERKLNPMDFVDRFPHIIAENGFDAIVGNPPYGNLSSESAAPYLEKHYGIETGISDFYAVFIARCLEILKRDASVGYIVPSAWLGGPAYERFRSLCLKHSISEIISLPFDVFKDAYVDTLIVILQAGPPKPDHKVKVYAFPKKAKINNEDLHHAAFQSIRQSRWSDSEGKKFVLDAGSLDLHGKMREKISGTLADFVEIKRGVLFRKELLTDAKIAVKSYPYFEGDVYRYELNYQAPQWIVFDDQMDERPKEFKWFEGMRILLRRLVNRKQRLMAALMDKTCITNKNLYSVLVKDAALDSKFILGVLNSRLISKMYISRVSQATKDDFPQVTIKDILALPCPSPDKSCQDRMIKLVDHLMAAKKHLNNAKSDRDRDFYSNQCASFDRQIDALVYELYGLAPDEIKIVESAAV